MLVTLDDWVADNDPAKVDRHAGVERGECSVYVANVHLTWAAKFVHKIPTETSDKLYIIDSCWENCPETRPQIVGLALAILREQYGTGTIIQICDERTTIERLP